VTLIETVGCYGMEMNVEETKVIIIIIIIIIISR